MGDYEKLYLPLARGESRIVLTFADNKIAAVEPGEAFDPAEWERISREIESAILAGAPMTGRDYNAHEAARFRYANSGSRPQAISARTIVRQPAIRR
jgi:hypothetical protein